MVTPLEPKSDYDYGQMMGLLTIIRVLRLQKTITVETIERIERVTSEHLATYLSIPEEDVILMVDNLLEKT